MGACCSGGDEAAAKKPPPAPPAPTSSPKPQKPQQQQLQKPQQESPPPKLHQPQTPEKPKPAPKPQKQLPPFPKFASCSDYAPGMSGEFVCPAYCPRRCDPSAAVYGGGGGGDDDGAAAIAVEAAAPEDKQLSDAARTALIEFRNAQSQRRRLYAAPSCLCRAAVHAGVLPNITDEDFAKDCTIRVVCVAADQQEQEDAAAADAVDRSRIRMRRRLQESGAVLLDAATMAKALPEFVKGGEANDVTSQDVASAACSRFVVFL